MQPSGASGSITSVPTSVNWQFGAESSLYGSEASNEAIAIFSSSSRLVFLRAAGNVISVL